MGRTRLTYLVCCLTGLLCGGILRAQSPFDYIWPIDSPFVITGNYGELRPNHFHAGIDFSTSGKINLPVYCIEEGYISRIRISPYGYGKCIYVTHPGGKVSVYAHLNAFSLKALNVAQKFQYDTQSNEIDYMPPPRMYYVRKNEIIGLSGNTGGSSGPHLHFEIRDEKSEVPLNPLNFYRNNDRTKPELYGVAFYDLSDTASPKLLNSQRIKVKGDSMVLGEDHLVLEEGIVGIAFSGADRFYTAGNPNNIYMARLYVNDSLVYSHSLSAIAFSDSRFINEFSQPIGKLKYQKCFLPTNYPGSFFGKVKNNGRVLLDEKEYSKIRLQVVDEAGNSTSVQFFLRSSKKAGYKAAATPTSDFVNCMREFTGTYGDVRVTIPARTLFYSVNLVVNNSLQEDGKLKILPEMNLRQPVQICLKSPAAFWQNSSKMLLLGPSMALPVVRNDSVFYNLKDFGTFRLTHDTIPPKVRVDYTERRLKEAWQMDAFSFHVKDNLSGIGKYNIWLNNAWVLAEYDAKTELITYAFNEETPIGLLQFRVEVEDKVGNKTLFEYTLKK